MKNLQELKDKLHMDTISIRKGIITVRRSFFYTHGVHVDTYVALVKAVCPDAFILDSGEVWANFRGGASIAQGSHYYVKFELPQAKGEGSLATGPEMQLMVHDNAA